MFPIGGSDGWEELGTELEDEVLVPQLRPLPVLHTGIYYDSEPLNGVGDPATYIAVEFGTATVRAVRRSQSAEARLRQPDVFGAMLLDTLVIPPVFVPCKLVLTIFDDDRVTERWSVGTDTEHEAPYLVEPDRYAEQELDVAAGAATLGTVEVTIVDPARTPGDQDSGYVTEKLQRLGLADIAGRRAQLIRGLTEETYVVIADGPAGTPKMHDSYAAFSLPIRDTRETERKLRAFVGWNPTNDDEDDPDAADGVKSLLPDGVRGGYGYDPVNDVYLIGPSTSLLGRFKLASGSGTRFNPDTTGSVNLNAEPGNDPAYKTVSMAAAAALQSGIPEEQSFHCTGGVCTWKYRIRFPNLAVFWRDALPGDDWHMVKGTLVVDRIIALPDTPLAKRGPMGTSMIYNTIAIPDADNQVSVGVGSIAFGDSADLDNLPDNDQDIELFIAYTGPPTNDIPSYVEGITAGEFTRNVYAGTYSPRNEDGRIRPSGILYDEDALLQMIEPVRLRLFEVIDDARDWLEKHIYSPLGWVPALDDIGRVSPIYQGVPEDSSGLAVVNNAATEAAPNWNAGERIINVVSFTYPRDYRPTNPDNAETGDGLAARPITIEYEDSGSVERHGRQVFAIDGSAFRAIGDSEGNAIEGTDAAFIAALQAAYDAAVLAGDTVLAAVLLAQLNVATTASLIALEPGERLASDRGTQLLNRYSLGAPTMSVAVLRSALLTTRAGDWVLLDLSWFPDYVTGKRGLLGIAQVTALGDLDCDWRNIVAEQVTPLVIGS